MRIIFAGTPNFAIPSLEILNNHHQVVAVLTQPDKPRGRGLKLKPTPVKTAATKLGLSVLDFESLASSDIPPKLSALSPDLLVVVAYGKIIPKWLIDLPALDSINLHASLLPKYRGAAPIQRVLIEGEKVTGLTVISLDQGLDTGDILAQVKVEIEETDNAASLSEKLAKVGAKLLLRATNDLACGKVTRVKQNNQLATLAKKIEPQERLINWHQSAFRVNNLIRGLSPKPGAYSFFNGKQIKILKAKAIKNRNPSLPGTVEILGGRVFVSCQNSQLELLEVQPESKKLMSAFNFCRGYIKNKEIKPKFVS
jgi:methionyl-tRNA formyltransferase